MDRVASLDGDGLQTAKTANGERRTGNSEPLIHTFERKKVSFCVGSIYQAGCGGLKPFVINAWFQPVALLFSGLVRFPAVGWTHFMSLFPQRNPAGVATKLLHVRKLSKKRPTLGTLATPVIEGGSSLTVDDQG